MKKKDPSDISKLMVDTLKKPSYGGNCFPMPRHENVCFFFVI